MFRYSNRYDYVKKLSKKEYQEFINSNPVLSKNFRLNEFLKSQTASRMNIINHPSPEEFMNLYNLCRFVLQPIRDFYRRPISISSGYRHIEVNRAIGSSDTSQHVKGMACDFEVLGLSNYAVSLYLAKSQLNFDQLILEFNYKGNPQSGWIHISYDSNKINQRREVLTINRHGVKRGIYLD